MTIKKTIRNISVRLLSLTIILCFSGIGMAQKIGKGKDVKSQVFFDSIVYQVLVIEKGRIIQRADKLLNEKPRTVTATSSPRSAGGKHDFYSEGPYWWPDPANPDGPFIRKDGLRFPGRFQDHDSDLRNFSWKIGRAHV